MPISLFKQVALVCLTVRIFVNDIFIYLSVLVILPFFHLVLSDRYLCWLY